MDSNICGQKRIALFYIVLFEITWPIDVDVHSIILIIASMILYCIDNLSMIWMANLPFTYWIIF